MRVLVLGGTRFIGPPTVRALAAAGHEVTVFHRGQNRSELPAGVVTVLGDRSALGAHRETLCALAPDLVLDMRPLDERDAEAVMATFRGVASRVVAISSCDVYRAYGVLIRIEPGPIEPGPAHEDSPLRATLRPYRAQATGPDDFRHHYDKIPAERVFLGDPALPGTVLRLPMVYGPGDYQHRLHPYLKRMDDARPAILLSARLAGWRSPRSFVEDVAAAIALAVGNEHARGRIYNVAEPECRTERAWIESLALLAGWKGELLSLPESELPAHLRDDSRFEQDLGIASQRIRTELGFQELLPPEQRLARTMAWERAHPPATIDASAFDYPAEDRCLASRPRP